MNTIKLQWFQDGAQSLGTTSGESVLIDKLENIYVIGWVKGEIDIQGRIDKDTKTRLFIGKFANRGYIHWVKTFFCVSETSPIISTLDDDQNIIIVFVHGHNVEILKIATYGELLWNKTIKGLNLSQLFHNIRVVADTGIYVSGAFEGLIQTDDKLRGTSFVVKLSPHGEWDWTKSLPGKIEPIALIDKMLVMGTIDDDQVHLCTMDKDNFTATIYVMDDVNITKIHDIVVNKNNDIIIVGSRNAHEKSNGRVIEAFIVSPNGKSQLVNTITNLNVPIFVSLESIMIDENLFFVVKTQEKTYIYKNQSLWLTIDDHPTIGYPSIQKINSSIIIVGSYMIRLSIRDDENEITIQGKDSPVFYSAIVELQKPPILNSKPKESERNETKKDYSPIEFYPPIF